MPGTGTGGLSFAEIPSIVKISTVAGIRVRFCGTRGLSDSLSDEVVCAKIAEVERVKPNARITIVMLRIICTFLILLLTELFFVIPAVSNSLAFPGST